MSNNLILERFAWLPDGVFGRLIFPTGETFYTVEKPWLNNKPFKSCIPTGVYYLEQRHSPVVRTTSAGEFTEGWEVIDVHNREYIMIHPGNWPGDVEGCIAVGLDFGIYQNRQGKMTNTVTSSREAFRQVMELMDCYNAWTLDIRSYFPEWF